MRPSRAKMPATRAAGGFHPGALLLKLVFSSPFSYNQLCEPEPPADSDFMRLLRTSEFFRFI